MCSAPHPYARLCWCVLSVSLPQSFVGDSKPLSQKSSRYIHFARLEAGKDVQSFQTVFWNFLLDLGNGHWLLAASIRGHFLLLAKGAKGAKEGKHTLRPQPSEMGMHELLLGVGLGKLGLG